MEAGCSSLKVGRGHIHKMLSMPGQQPHIPSSLAPRSDIARSQPSPGQLHLLLSFDSLVMLLHVFSCAG